jgi:prevent-host-death family protein
VETWLFHGAKARFSELVKLAQHTPQQLTSHGQPVAVVPSAEACQRQQQFGHHHDRNANLFGGYRP